MGVNLFILLTVAIIYLFKLWPRVWNFLRIVKFSKTLKGPGPKELIEQIQNGELLYWLRNLRTRYGATFGIWFGLDFTVFLTDPEDIKLILGSNHSLHKSRNYKTIEPWLGKGLLLSSGELWHSRRKMLTPAFHFKMLAEFKQPMEDNCNILIEKLKEKANGEAFDIVYHYITLLALDIICETAMGIKKNAQLQSTSEYVTAVQNMCRISHRQSFSPWKRIAFLFRFTEDFKERNHALDILHGETNRVIAMRRSSLKTSNIQTLADAANTIDESGVKKRLAFLDILLLAQAEGADLSDVDIREEVDTFMFEGHDTTSSALAFAIYLLSQNKAAQQKAFEEAVALEGKEKDTMKYLEAVIKETLRLYPSVPFYSRLMTEDVKIRNLHMPKGSAVSLLAYAVHRNEKYFPEPDLFSPERFLDEENQLHPYAFIAFSAGPRNCIGQKFAMLELKCTLSNILREYELLPVEGFVPLPLAELVLKSGNGIQVRLRKR
ncbi:LOW QUALITY PROTEIN: probable cytochrome P450 4s3 [Eupeodes corollae]|uniref:LOW QUALITY PROTEIN: probable cytochrome P450 4s3 n=1 Tax=Eupeodes corollae TaxID=290404 RepID=UPI002490A9DE|nr:LOW QUALITY PROTEIN: probable cytochrome P450 4s3 [Eupeodes corollae]